MQSALNGFDSDKAFRDLISMLDEFDCMVGEDSLFIRERLPKNIKRTPHTAVAVFDYSGKSPSLKIRGLSNYNHELAEAVIPVATRYHFSCDFLGG